MQPVPEHLTKPPEVRGGERRQRARHSPSALTYVTLGEDNGGIIANISETGMYVTAGQPLRENFFSRVSFKIPQTGGAIETQAEVVWTSESKKEAGVRFVELREENRELIRKWVAPARRNGGGSARPAENPREATKQVKLTPPPAPAPSPASESASAAPAAPANRDPAGAEPREVIPETTPEPFVPREPERIPAAVARSIALSEKDAAPELAFSGLGPRAWELTEAQRAEFERLFPSENASAAAHEAVTRAAEIAAPTESQPIAERFAGYAVSPFDAPREETARENFAIAESPAAPPAPAVESEAAIERQTSEAPPVADAIPPAATPRTTTQSLWDAPPPMMESAPGVARSNPEDAPTSRAAFAGAVPQTPMQSLWDTPPPMMRPIIGGSYDRSFGSAYGATAAEPLEDGRSKSMWSVATVAVLVVAACFLLGFLVGPDGLRAWPKVDAARGVVVAELGHLKNAVTGSGSAAGPKTGTAPAVSSTPAPSGQNAPASASTTPALPTAPAVAPPLDAAASAAPAPSAPDTTGPAAEHSGTDENAPSTSASTADSGHGRDNADTTSPPVLTPERTESAPAATSNKSDSERKEAEAARAAREAEIEKERAAAAEAYAEERAAASAAREAARPTPSTPAAETAKPAVSNPSRAETSKLAATPPAETVPHPAAPSAPPESYFPVVAPGAGNVPRLIELPEERIIDTAAVVIHSHQYVFVPAEPGPESSHALEKLQIGDRITKMAPLYPAEAAQKAMGGTVHVRAIIGKDGRVEDVRPLNGPLMLITAAVDSILQWRYQPTLLAGQPIEVQEDFTVEFRPLGLH